MEDKIFDIVTDLIRDDISKNEAIATRRVNFMLCCVLVRVIN